MPLNEDAPSPRHPRNIRKNQRNINTVKNNARGKKRRELIARAILGRNAHRQEHVEVNDPTHPLNDRQANPHLNLNNGNDVNVNDNADAENEEDSYEREMQQLLRDNEENQSEHSPASRAESVTQPAVPADATFPLNFMRRVVFEVKEDSIWKTFTDEKTCCRVIYSFVEMSGYALPPYKSKPISVNYCIGVYEKHYYGLKDTLQTPLVFKKVRKIILYYELVRHLNKPLGYDSTNLPPASYLRSLLYTINEEHFLFALPSTKWKLQVNPDTGMYVVPISCQGFIQTDKHVAHTLTTAHILSGTFLKGINHAANTLQAVEDIRKRLAQLKKLFRQTAYAPGVMYEELKKRIHIR